MQYQTATQKEIHEHRSEVAKQVIHDKLESQIKTADAKLDPLEAPAETAQAGVEIKAIAKLLTRNQ